MLNVMSRSGRTVPILCCDCCGAWIANAGLAAAVYKPAVADEEVGQVFLAHKGGCHDQLEARLGGPAPWLELTKYLEDAMHNSGHSLEDQILNRQEDDEIGRL